MKTITRILILCLVVFFSSQSPSPAQENAESPPRLKKLLDAQIELERVKHVTREERAALISQFISFVEEHIEIQKETPRVEAAFALLGRLSATESVDTLVKYAGYPNFFVRKDGSWAEFGPNRRGPITLWAEVELRDYPAAAALIKIGEPSLDAVIRKIAAGEDLGAESTALHEVLRRLDGPAVRTRLARAIRAARKPEVKERLITTVIALELKKEEASLTPEELQKRRQREVQEILEQLQGPLRNENERAADSDAEAGKPPL